jgi:hypothetical protein
MCIADLVIVVQHDAVFAFSGVAADATIDDILAHSFDISEDRVRPMPDFVRESDARLSACKRRSLGSNVPGMLSVWDIRPNGQQPTR